MGGINTSRWLASGIVAGLVIWVIEGLGAMFYMDAMTAALAAHNLSMEMDASVWVMTVVVSLLVGLTLMFFYAATRPRFGPGPRTAIIVAFMYWLGAYVVSLVGYGMVDLYPTGMLYMWGLIGLVELIIAGLVGGWIYRETVAV